MNSKSVLKLQGFSVFQEFFRILNSRIISRIFKDLDIQRAGYFDNTCIYMYNSKNKKSYWNESKYILKVLPYGNEICRKKFDTGYNIKIYKIIFALLKKIHFSHNCSMHNFVNNFASDKQRYVENNYSHCVLQKKKFCRTVYNKFLLINYIWIH